MFLRILVVIFWILALLPPASAQTSRRKAQRPGATRTPASATPKAPAPEKDPSETDPFKISVRQSEPKGWVWVSHTIDLAQQLGGEDNIMTLDGEPLPVMQKKRVTLGVVIDDKG